jgi:hypothetical protein
MRYLVMSMVLVAVLVIGSRQAEARRCRIAPRARAAVRSVVKRVAERRPARRVLRAVQAVRPKLFRAR